MDGHRRVIQRLIISVAYHEVNIMDAFTIHVVDGVSAPATYTDHLDDALMWLGFVEI
jgi:hypothetical protein